MNAHSSSITIVRHALQETQSTVRRIPIEVDRWQLAKLRWRATAGDAREFGFELEHPLRHGDIVSTNDYAIYVIEQLPENVLVLSTADSTQSTALAWAVGNLHQPLQISGVELVVPDDPALRQLFDQQGVHYRTEQRIFDPIRSVISHHHHSH